MWKKSLNIAIACGSWVFFLLFSCVDQNYDLSKDIDLTMNVGGKNLALPMGNTDSMFLSKFVKVEEGEDALLQYGEDGITYKLLTGEEMEDTKISITSVTIDVEPTELDDVDDIFIPQGVGPDTPIAGLPLTTEGDLVLENSNMPEEIISIYSLIPGRIDSKLPQLSLAFNISEKNNKSLDAVKEILLANFTLTLPKCLVLAGDQVTSKADSQDSDKYTTYTIGSASFSPTNPRVFSLDLTSISFEDEEGGLAIELLEPGRGFKREYEVSLTSDITIQLLSPPVEALELVLTPVVSISPIPIARVFGQVGPEIDIKPTEVPLDGLPDFLQGDAVILDLADPQIYLYVNNPIDLPIDLTITMQGSKKQEEGESLKTKLITTTQTIPAQVTKDDPIVLSNSTIKDFSKLFIIEDGEKRGGIPDTIRLDITANANQDKKHTIDLGDDVYPPIKMEYKIDMPLSFGPELIIIYNETVDGWNDQIKDLEMDNISIITNVKNTIPLELHIEGTAIDEDGNTLTGIKVTAEKAIDAGKGEKKDPTITKSLTITIKGSKSDMKKLDGIVLGIKANATKTVNNIPLNSSQYVIMQKIGAKIAGGMNIDLN
ncbi:hypothetical protein EZS27_022392 [termite gut metagenome]|uniref:Uncharacterized protein n=1 Tax=termite gut metagenome TaxID=433724 RepID=A0A5J4R4X1_9ZZZZ